MCAPKTLTPLFIDSSPTTSIIIFFLRFTTYTRSPAFNSWKESNDLNPFSSANASVFVTKVLSVFDFVKN